MADGETAVEASVPRQNGVLEEHSAAVEQPPMRAPVVQQSVVQKVVHHHEESFHETKQIIQEHVTMTGWPPMPVSGTQASGPQRIEITLSKEDGQSWGFRLGGGKEFGTPLNVIKVQLGGLAERQGFQVGDEVEQINGVPTTELNHNDALDVINKGGNKCLFSILRDPAAKGKVPRPFQTMAPLQDFTTILPNSIGSRPTVAGPVAAKAVMRDVTLGQRELNTQLTEMTFTEEVIAETMTSHAEIVAGNALGVNFHKFEPQYEHLALSSVYQMLLEEESKRGRPMTLPRRKKPEIVPKKGQPAPKEPPPPPREPTPPPKEPTPPPKEPTPPPKEATPPPEEIISEKELTPPPKEATPPPEEEPHDNEPHENNVEAELVAEPALELVAEPEPEYLEAEAPTEPLTNGEDKPKPEAYYQKHHELSKKQQELLERQIKHKMHLEDCRKRINQAQRTIYTPTPPTEIVVEDLVTGIERKLPKAGARYKPSLPLTSAASLHTAFSTKVEAFEPFQARATPTFQPKADFVKPCAKPAAPITTVIPFKEWHPPKGFINGQPYKYTPTCHKPSKPEPPQEFLPPPEPKLPKPESLKSETKPDENWPPKPVAHPVQPCARPDIPKQIPTEQLTEDDIAEMMSANAEVIVGQTLGVNFQKYMPGFDHLQNSAVYRMVHGLED